MMLGCGAIATLGLAACGGTNLTVEQADAKGYAVSKTLAALRAGREEPGQPMLVTLPASLWQERGLEPPADRSGRGAFVIGSETELVEVSFTPPASCVDDENTPFRRLDLRSATRCESKSSTSNGANRAYFRVLTTILRSRRTSSRRSTAIRRAVRW